MKKILIYLIILSILLLSIAGVSATENKTDDTIVSIENEDIDEISNIHEIKKNNDLSYDDSLSKSDSGEILDTGSYFRPGPSGYIDSEDMTTSYKGSLGYGVRLVGGSPSGESVCFIVYYGDSGTHIGDYYTTADSNGYAYLNEDFKPGVYWIKMVSDNYGSVYNTITVKINGYANEKIYITNTYYKCDDGDIIFSWEGYLNAYFNIYKGKKLIYKKHIYPDAPGVDSDDESSEYVYLTKKLPMGNYILKIINDNGKVIKQASFKVTKMPVKFYCHNSKFNSGGTKYITFEVSDEITHGKVSGSVQIKLNGKSYKAKLNNGKAKIKVKLPSNKKTYKCNAFFSGNDRYKSNTKKFTITVKKDKSNVVKKSNKKITKFTVVVPTELNKKYIKRYGEYKVITYKWIDYNSNGKKDAHLRISVYKNGKKLTGYDAKYWVHYKNGGGVWIYTKNAGKGYESHPIGYNNVLRVDKVTATIWP